MEIMCNAGALTRIPIICKTPAPIIIMTSPAPMAKWAPIMAPTLLEKVGKEVFSFIRSAIESVQLWQQQPRLQREGNLQQAEQQF